MSNTPRTYANISEKDVDEMRDIIKRLQAVVKNYSGDIRITTTEGDFVISGQEGNYVVAAVDRS